jgi:hypothetical protein
VKRLLTTTTTLILLQLATNNPCSAIISGASLTMIIAVAAAGAGVILIFLTISLICCCCKKRNRYEGPHSNQRSVSPTPSTCSSPSRPSSAAPTLVMVQSVGDSPSIRRPIPILALPAVQDAYMYPANSPDRGARARPIAEEAYMYPAYSPDRAALRGTSHTNH